MDSIYEGDMSFESKKWPIIGQLALNVNGPKAQTNTNSEVHLETGWDNMLSFKLDWGGGGF